MQHLRKIYGEERNIVEQILLSGAGDLGRDITDYIRKTNRWSSARMAAENLLTASAENNLRYLLAKLQKRGQ